MNVSETEREKYTRIWRDIPEYRAHSPGLENVERFYSVLHPRRGSSLIDIGCGAGVAGLEFAKRGLEVSYVDITDAGLDASVDRIHFVEQSLWSHWDRRFKHGADYGFCCDVMEHIPPEFTMLVIDRIVSCCRTSWFQIALQPDEFGKAIGQPLHLTVMPFIWWRDRLKQFGNLVEARDLCGVAMYVVKR